MPAAGFHFELTQTKVRNPGIPKHADKWSVANRLHGIMKSKCRPPKSEFMQHLAANKSL